MSVRKPAPDAASTELARRRLSQLGVDLSGAGGPGAAGPGAGGPGADLSGDRAPGDLPEDGRTAPVRSRAGRHARARLSTTTRVLGRAADTLPPSLHGRLRVTAQHVTVVALVLAAAMALAAWLVIRSEPEQVPVPRRASLQLPTDEGTDPTASGREPGAPGPAAVDPAAADPAVAGQTVAGSVSADPTTAGPDAVLIVHVTGKVRDPGIVELPPGARVVDAVEAAGGARRGVVLSSLNLARPLVDGEQIAVGVRGAMGGPVAAGAPVGTPASGAPTGLVNLNTATQEQLEELPGVGPVTATSIIEWRTEHGGFNAVQELLEVSGIGEVTLGELRDLVTP